MRAGVEVRGKRRFYALPPAGTPIPLGAAFGAAGRLRNYGHPHRLEAIERYLGTPHAFFLSSGRAALVLVLSALSRLRPRRKQVVLPAYTCPSVFVAVRQAGLQPVLCDLEPLDFGLQRRDLEGKTDENTLAVVVVHLFGYPSEITPVVDLARRCGAFVVEDAAQAFGNVYPDDPACRVGTRGDAGFFSFGRGKPLGVLHGGLACCGSEEVRAVLAERYRTVEAAKAVAAVGYPLQLAAYTLLCHPRLFWIPQGLPFLHLGETVVEKQFEVRRGLRAAAALICGLLADFEQDRETRKRNVEFYRQELTGLAGLGPPPGRAEALCRYPLLVADPGRRDRLLERLRSHGTGAALFYPRPLQEVRELGALERDCGELPHATRLSRTLVTLPVHAGLRPADRARILSLIHEEFRA